MTTVKITAPQGDSAPPTCISMMPAAPNGQSSSSTADQKLGHARKLQIPELRQPMPIKSVLSRSLPQCRRT